MTTKNGKPTPVSKIKNEIQRIDWKIIERLVRLLYYHSKLKKTHISTKCNLSYDKCCRYLDWMEIMDLIKKEDNEEGFEIVLLTERGSTLYNKKFRDLKKELSYLTWLSTNFTCHGSESLLLIMERHLIKCAMNCVDSVVRTWQTSQYVQNVENQLEEYVQDAQEKLRNTCIFHACLELTLCRHNACLKTILHHAM